MATIVTRAGKGSPLTHTEVDANFTNLNDGITTNAAITGGTIDNTSIGATTPAAGSFTTAQASNLRVNQAWDEGTGRLQVMGQAAVEGNVVAQDVVVQGGNNLFQRSEEFNHVYWGKSGATIAANAAIAPDGTLSADKVIMDNGVNPSVSDASGVVRFESIPSNVYTYSFYLKAAEFSLVRFRENLSLGNFLNINLAAETISTSGGSGQFINPKLEKINDGWYRVSFSTPLITAVNKYSLRANETGDGTSGFYVWGAQLELGTVASPYTPTTSAAVTTTNDIFVPSGQVLASAGTASLPAISNLNDTNTGIFFPAADTIAFAEGGAEAMRITADGRLAVGQTTATERLSVNGNIALSEAGNLVLGTTTGTKIGTATSQKIAFWNATPIVQPTTGVAAATVAATGLGDVVAASTTFDGYTIPQVVKALRNAGLLA
jgi:hypothetical protein